MHRITIEIDEERLNSYSDQHPAVCWHVAQANPAPIEDHMAGKLAEKIGREIIRRWLTTTPPELWHHQGGHHYWSELIKLAKYEPGGPDSSPEWNAGRWAPKDAPKDRGEQQTDESPKRDGR